jgi:hypothetical protein
MARWPTRKAPRAWVAVSRSVYARSDGRVWMLGGNGVPKAGAARLCLQEIPGGLRVEASDAAAGTATDASAAAASAAFATLALPQGGAGVEAALRGGEAAHVLRANSAPELPPLASPGSAAAIASALPPRLPPAPPASAFLAAANAGSAPAAPAAAGEDSAAASQAAAEAPLLDRSSSGRDCSGSGSGSGRRARDGGRRRASALPPSSGLTRVLSSAQGRQGGGADAPAEAFVEEAPGGEGGFRRRSSGPGASGGSMRCVGPEAEGPSGRVSGWLNRLAEACGWLAGVGACVRHRRPLAGPPNAELFICKRMIELNCIELND